MTPEQRVAAFIDEQAARHKRAIFIQYSTLMAGWQQHWFNEARKQALFQQYAHEARRLHHG